MNLFVEYSSYSRFKKQYQIAGEAIGKTVDQCTLIVPRTVPVRAVRFLKRRVAETVVVLCGFRGFRKAVRLAKQKKHPISLSLRLSSSLTKKQKKQLLNAKVRICIDYRDSDPDSVAFIASLKTTIFKTKENNGFLKADLALLSRGFDAQYQCVHTSCLGNTLYIDRFDNVSFCPEKPEISRIGTIRQKQNYLSETCLSEVLDKAIEKRRNCAKECVHFAKCQGACPLEDGCMRFPENYSEAAKEISDIIENQKALSGYPYAVIECVLKDVAYF